MGARQVTPVLATCPPVCGDGVDLLFFYFARIRCPMALRMYRVIGGYDIYLSSNFRVDRAPDGRAPCRADVCSVGLFLMIFGPFALFLFCTHAIPDGAENVQDDSWV
jgi:hypothetical protein